MLIAIDVRQAAQNRSGKGVYTLELVRALLKIDKENEYVLYTDKLSDTFSDFSSGNIRVVPGRGLWWHLAVIPDWKKLCRGGLHKDSVFFAPTSYIIPTLMPRTMKSLVTVHDLVAFLHPQLHEQKSTIIESLFIRRALKKTSHVVVPSHHTKNDLMSFSNMPSEKISVTPLGVGQQFFEALSEIELQHVKTKYNLPREFLLCVAGLEPRKNVAAIIKALEILKKRAHKIPPLIIIGGTGWKSEGLQKEITARKENIVHLTNVERNELHIFYKHATALIFPSLYEGFGLPILEAMASGCPVITANNSSLPEVGGEAVIYADAQNPDAIGDSIFEIISNAELREKLQKGGLAQAKKFPWELTAQKTLNVLRNLYKPMNPSA